MSNIVHECGAISKNLSVSGTTIELPASANLLVLLDERDITDSGGYLAGWGNQGSRGGTFTSVDEASRPAIDVITLNGHPVIKAYKDGLLKRTSIRHIVDTSASLSAFSFAALIKAVPASDGSNYFYYARSGFGTDNCGLFSDLSAPGWGYYKAYTSTYKFYGGSPVDISGEWHIVLFTYSSSGTNLSKYYVDGVEGGSSSETGSVGGFPLGEIGYGMYPDGGGVNAGGQLATMMLWDKVLSTEEIAMLSLYVANKYGVS